MDDGYEQQESLTTSDSAAPQAFRSIDSEPSPPVAHVPPGPGGGDPAAIYDAMSHYTDPPTHAKEAPKDAEWKIENHRAVAVANEPVLLSVPGAKKHTRPGARYMAMWTVFFDDKAVSANKTRPSRKLLHEPRPCPSIETRLEIPGTHKVVCELTWEGVAPPPAARQMRLETTITLRDLDAYSKEAFGRFDELTAYQRVLDELVAKDHPEHRAALDKHEKQNKERLAALKPGTQVPVRATISDGTTGRGFALNIVIGRGEKFVRNQHGPGIRRDLVKLLDLTRGAARVEYEGATVEDAIADLQSRNLYPAGMVELEAPAGAHGPAIRTQFKTTGTSALQEWALALGLVSVALIATAVTGGVASPLLVLATTVTSAASAGLTLLDHLDAEKLDKRQIMIDVVQLTASMLPFVGMGGRVVAGGRPAIEIAKMPGRWLALTQLAVDGTEAILITADAYEELQNQLSRSDIPKEERERHIILFIANLVQRGLIIGFSAAHVTSTMREHVPAGVPPRMTHTPDGDIPRPQFSDERMPMPQLTETGLSVELSKRTNGKVTTEQIAQGISARQLFEAYPVGGMPLYRGMRVERDESGRLLIYSRRPTEMGGEPLQPGIHNFTSDPARAREWAHKPGGLYEGDVEVVLVTRPIPREEALKYLQESNFDPRIFDSGKPPNKYNPSVAGGQSDFDKWDLRPNIHLPEIVVDIQVKDIGRWRSAKPGEVVWMN